MDNHSSSTRSLCFSLGYFPPLRRQPRRSVCAAQVPGGVLAWHAEVHGALAHLPVERVQGSHQLVVAFALGLPLGCIE